MDLSKFSHSPKARYLQQPVVKDLRNDSLTDSDTVQSKQYAQPEEEADEVALESDSASEESAEDVVEHDEDDADDDENVEECETPVDTELHEELGYSLSDYPLKALPRIQYFMPRQMVC